MRARPGIDLTHHCVERFQERSRPALELLKAREELELLVGVGDVADQPPGWFAAGSATDADSYLLIGDDIVIPLKRVHERDSMAAVTCIVRGVPSEATRARWNLNKRTRRAKREAARRAASRPKRSR